LADVLCGSLIGVVFAYPTLSNQQPTSTMADEGQTVTVNVKGPSEIKLTVQITLDSTVRGLKEKIAEQRSDIPADSYVMARRGPVI
jgi:hypothetical protein